MNYDCIDKLELNKILAEASAYAVTDKGRDFVKSRLPVVDIKEVRYNLELTAECNNLLFKYGLDKIICFNNVESEVKRASKKSVLSCSELLNVGIVLKAARSAYENIKKTEDDDVPLIKAIIHNLYFDKNLEEDIFDKIISADSVSDNASLRLFEIRAKIKSLNERIRSKLSEYVSGKNAEFLQESLVTIRNDRYVIPVKAEHKSHVKGFIHDRSKTGSTFFIEPEYILELNNELIALSIDEREEVEEVLRGLSARVGSISNQIIDGMEILYRLDGLFAQAEYAYITKSVQPKINDSGYINIIKGRHPLIARDKVVPVSVELGDKYNYLLLSGANTGGKTVTLKMVGLFCLMASCGLFIPASGGSSVSVFTDVFCDIGDSQSIEDDLSTFSSHITNLKYISDRAEKNSLVLIDEPGGGTNPDEGQALAKAIVKHLLERGSKGIVTTHYTSLKEYAYKVGLIENASMEFDADTLKPLYRVKIGLPGASNALSIARRLGLSETILHDAESFLSDGAKNYENVLTRAENSRLEAEKKLSEISELQREWREKVAKINEKTEEINKEKEKINRSARTETRRIVAEKTAMAEEILLEIEELFRKEELKETDLIAARTLKNKLKNSAFDEENEVKKVREYSELSAENIKVGIKVYVKPMGCEGTVAGYNPKNGEAEVVCGNLKMHLKLKELSLVGESEETPKKIKVIKQLPKTMPVLEINVLGLTVPEAIYEVDNFIDRALTDNLEEIKIIHGVGTGKLRSAISEHLKRHKRVESFRLGKYGEGETGVTFIKLK